MAKLILFNADLDKLIILETIEYSAADNLKNMNLDYKIVKVQVG